MRSIDLVLFGPLPGDYLPGAIPMREPYDGSSYVVPVDDAARCPNPACVASRDHGPVRAEFQVSGGTPTEVEDRRVEARAACRSCGFGIGKLVVYANTIFGLEEDRRVTGGRPRVY